MNEYVAIFLEGYNSVHDFDSVCEASCCKAYNQESGEDIAIESFGQKVKESFDKVCETIKKWIEKVKNALSSVKKWVVKHAKELLAKFKGKKEVEGVSSSEGLIEAANKIEEAAKAVEIVANKGEEATPEPSLKEKVTAAFAKAKEVVTSKFKKTVTPNDVIKHVDATEKAADRIVKAIEITRTSSRKIKGGWARGAASSIIKTGTTVLKKGNSDNKKMLGGSVANAEVNDFNELMDDPDDEFEGVAV